MNLHLCFNWRDESKSTNQEPLDYKVDIEIREYVTAPRPYQPANQFRCQIGAPETYLENRNEIDQRMRILARWLSMIDNAKSQVSVGYSWRFSGTQPPTRSDTQKLF